MTLVNKCRTVVVIKPVASSGGFNVTERVVS